MTLKEMQQRVRLYRRDTRQPDQHGEPIFEHHVTYYSGYHLRHRTEIITTNVCAFNRIFFAGDCGWLNKQRIPTLHYLTEKEAYIQLIDECIKEDSLDGKVTIIHAQERRGEK